jgi:hypothetical protein
MKALLILLVVPFAATALAAQDTSRAVSDSLSRSGTRLYRDPHRAQVLGTIIPGAGQVYAGEYWRGFGDGIGAITGIGLGAVVYSQHRKPFCIISPCPPASQWPHRLAGAVMVGIGVWTWISDARDAPHAAERANTAHRAKSVAVIPFIESATKPRNEFRGGLAVSW